MNSKQQYQSAYRFLRSQWNWNLKDTPSCYKAFQLSSKLFGSEMTTLAYNSLCGKPTIKYAIKFR